MYRNPLHHGTCRYLPSSSFNKPLNHKSKTVWVGGACVYEVIHVEEGGIRFDLAWGGPLSHQLLQRHGDVPMTSRHTLSQRRKDITCDWPAYSSFLLFLDFSSCIEHRPRPSLVYRSDVGILLFFRNFTETLKGISQICWMTGPNRMSHGDVKRVE